MKGNYPGNPAFSPEFSGLPVPALRFKRSLSGGRVIFKSRG